MMIWITFKEQEMKKIKHNVMGNKPKITRDKLKDKIINDIWNLLKQREKKKKKIRPNQRITKDGIIRDSRTLFEQQEDYYEPKKVGNFWNNNWIWE